MSRPAFVAVLIIKTIHNLFDQFMFHSCRFMPSCSFYAQQAIGAHGLRRGSGLILRRLARCQPFGPHGFDPVP